MITVHLHQLRWWVGLCGVVIPATVADVPVHAQSTTQDVDLSVQANRSMPVQERLRPGFDAIGIPIGSVLVFPRVTASLAATDNVFARDGDREGDVTARGGFDVEVRSDTADTRSFVVYAAALQDTYFRNGGENATTGRVGGRGTVSYAREGQVELAAELRHDVEPRTVAATAANALERAQYDYAFGSIAVQHSFNRLVLRGSLRADDVSFSTLDTSDGPVALRERDYRTASGSVRVGYRVRPDITASATVNMIRRRYDLLAQVAGFDRDFDGLEALIGVQLELPGFARGEVSAGLLRQNSADPRIETVQEVGFRGRLDLFPTALTTIGLRVDRSVIDIGTIGAANGLASTAGVTVDHELLRNLILSADLAYTRETFEGLDRGDDLVGGRAEMRYLLSHMWTARLRYDLVSRASRGSNAGQTFTANAVRLEVTLQY
jgi:hypothetical protein